MIRRFLQNRAEKKRLARFRRNRENTWHQWPMHITLPTLADLEKLELTPRAMGEYQRITSKISIRVMSDHLTLVEGTSSGFTFKDVMFPDGSTWYFDEAQEIW